MSVTKDPIRGTWTMYTRYVDWQGIVREGKIDKLTSQVQILKDKLAKTEAFLKFKGLLEEFKESLKPKSLKRDLQDKQVMSEERERKRQKDEVKKDKGIAI